MKRLGWLVFIWTFVLMSLLLVLLLNVTSSFREVLP